MSLYHELQRDYLDTLALRGRSPKTLENYRDTLKQLGTWFEGTDSESLEDPSRWTPRRMLRFLAAARDRGLSLASQQKLYRDLKAFFGWVTEEEPGALPVNPMTRVPAPKGETVPVNLVHTETVKKLLEAPARSRFYRTRNRALVLFLYDTGVRASELCGIRCTDIRWDVNVVRVTGKTGTRDVPFGTATGVALRRYRRERSQRHDADTDWFWLGASGRLETSGLRETVLRMCDAVDVERVTLHAFRHTFAHHFLLNGGDVLSLQSIGGWRNARQLSDTYGLSGRSELARSVHQRVSPGDRL